MTYPTALVSHPDCALHDPGWGHPDHQGRLPAVVRALTRDTPSLIERVLQREPEPAGEDALRLAHSDALIDRVREAAGRAAGNGEPVFLDADTAVSASSWDAATAAVGCAIEAARLVFDGQAATAFALTRPPGHHATADAAMGFCLFNHVAIAARWLQRERGVGRVMIVDWDVHHGNGTQDIFYDDPSVYYLSLHLDPHWPGTGSARERGVEAGAGTTRNVPIPHGTGAAAYRRALEQAVDDALVEFEPEFLLVSAGFDCLAGDPLGGVLLEPADLHAMARLLLDRAADVCGGRVAALLEGGYVPDRVGAGVVDVLRAFGGLPAKGG